MIDGEPGKRYYSAAVLGVLLAVFALFDAWSYAGSQPGIDFYQFWVAAQVIAEPGTVDLYSVRAEREIGDRFHRKTSTLPAESRQRRAASQRPQLETYSTPFLYTMFRLVASGDYDRDFRLYQFICIATTVVSIALLCRGLAFPFMFVPFAIIAFTVWFEPFKSDLRVGNVNQIQLGFLAVFLWVQSQSGIPYRHAVAGVVLGLAVMFKPNIILMLAFLGIVWLLNGRYRRLSLTIGGIAIGVVLSLIISSVSFGSADCWMEWQRKAWQLTTDSAIIPVVHGNFSLVQILDELTGLRLAIPLLLLFSTITVVFLWKDRSRKTATTTSTALPEPMGDSGYRDATLAAGAGIAMMLLVSQLAWMHYYLLLIPLILYFLRPIDSAAAIGRPARRARYFGPAVCIVLLSNLPLPTFAAVRSAFLIAAPVVLTAMVLFGMALRELSRDRYAPHSE